MIHHLIIGLICLAVVAYGILTDPHTQNKESH